jgi:activator of HSP90 ATPase
LAGIKGCGGMMSDQGDEAVTINAPTRRQIIVGAASACGAIVIGSVNAWGDTQDGISHSAESIHQEAVFKASRRRIYEALTDSVQFHKVTLLSEAMRSGMAPGMKPTEISREVGGAFSLFGGYVTGRQIELVPNERIVEAWRAGSWDLGIYSIAKFDLVEQGSGTKIVFHHTGFPEGQAEHLAAGWKGNYWEPLQKFLA